MRSGKSVKSVKSSVSGSQSSRKTTRGADENRRVEGVGDAR